jgi:hypothetical protein
MDATNTEQNNKENIDFAFQVMGKKLDSQAQAHSALESKIGLFLGFVGVIAGSAIALLQGKSGLLGLNIFTIGLTGIYVSLIALVAASQTKTYYDPPDFNDFYSDPVLKQPHIDLKNQVISNMKEGYGKNQSNQKLKGLLYNFAVYCFLLSILFLFLGIIERR